MRSSLIYSAALATVMAVGGSAGLAQTAPPVDQVPVPAPVAVAPNSTAVGVLVLPFRMIGGDSQAAWISQAIDEDLRADLTKNTSVNLLTLPAKMPTSANEAMQAGFQGGATYVIYGTYQIVDGNVRVTGSVINSAQGRIAAPIVATGSLHELFQVEDLIASQVRDVLPAAEAPVGEYTAPAAASYQPTYYYPTQPVTVDQGYYAPATYGYGYCYPYTPYCYNGWYDGGLGIVVGGGFGFHNGFDRGFDHHGFDGRGFGNRGGFVGPRFGGGAFIAPRFGGAAFGGGGGFRGGGGFHGGGGRR